MDTKLSKSLMEVILRPSPEVLECIIFHLLSSPEEIQSIAESIFNMMKQKDQEWLTLKLADFLCAVHHDNDFRKKCAVLLLDLSFTDVHEGHNLNVLSESNKKCVLLNLIKVEQSNSIITNKLCNTVAELASKLLPHNNWPQLLPFLNECVTSNSNRLTQSFFLIFARLAKGTYETLVPEIMISHSVFLNRLNDGALDLHVRIAVLATAVKFILSLPSLNERKHFYNLLPAMLKTLTDTLSKAEEVLAQNVIEELVVLGKDEPRFFRMQLTDVKNTMFEIIEDKSLNEQTRHLAIEFLLTLVEARAKAPGMMKRLPLFTSTCFALLLNLLVDIKDELRWHVAKTDLEEAGATPNYKLGVLCLDRFSIALGGKTIAPIAIDHLSTYIIAPEWEKCHAALVALTCIAEGCSKDIMIKYLKRIVSMVLRSFKNPHPRVRYAAIEAIAELSIRYSPHLQEQYRNQVLPAFAEAMDDFRNPRVQAHAAVSLRNFCISEKLEAFLPYLDGLVTKLRILLQNDNQMVQEAALHALASIADLSKEHFQEYYNCVMPYMKDILIKANYKCNYMLQRNAVESISLVAMAVGKEKFRADLEEVMNMLKSSQESPMKEFETITYILTACCRICLCMGKDFLPYMSTVMPPLVEFAQLESDKTLSTDKLDYSIHKVKFGDEIICAKGRKLLEGKSMACAILCLYAHRLEEDFYPWITRAYLILVPLLKFYIHDDVRHNVGQALSSLLRSAKMAVLKWTSQGGNELYFKPLLRRIILALVDALTMESKTKVCASMLREMNKCLMITGPLLDEGQVHSIINVIKHVMTARSLRKQELRETEKTEDFDAEEADLLRGERGQEDVVFFNVGEILRTLIKAFTAAFLPFFDELSSFLLPMWDKEKTAIERYTSICIFNALVKECPEEALKYYDVCLSLILDSSNDEDPAVRQAALYGLGLWAEYDRASFKPFVGEAISRINVVIMHYNAVEPENLWAYDNAVSTLGKICRFHGESINLVQVIPAWLNCLPIKADLDEAKLVHEQLCSMVERLDGELIGPNYQYVPKIISVFAEVLYSQKDLATEETAKRMINALRNLQKALPPPTLESALPYLLPRQEMELKFILLPDEYAN